MAGVPTVVAVMSTAAVIVTATPVMAVVAVPVTMAMTNIPVPAAMMTLPLAVIPPVVAIYLMPVAVMTVGVMAMTGSTENYAAGKAEDNPDTNVRFRRSTGQKTQRYERRNGSLDTKQRS